MVNMRQWRGARAWEQQRSVPCSLLMKVPLYAAAALVLMAGANFAMLALVSAASTPAAQEASADHVEGAQLRRRDHGRGTDRAGGGCHAR